MPHLYARSDQVLVEYWSNMESNEATRENILQHLAMNGIRSTVNKKLVKTLLPSDRAAIDFLRYFNCTHLYTAGMRLTKAKAEVKRVLG
jgi:hypothetical protein